MFVYVPPPPLLPVVKFISPDSFGVSCLVLEILAIENPQKIHLKEEWKFPEIMTQLIKKINRLCCEQIHVGKKVLVSKKVVPL